MTQTRERRRELRRVLLSSYLGSTIEFYDFLLYGLAASLVFNRIFFTDLDPVVGTIAAFATLAVGYVARPLGGVIFGHYGDKLGRKTVLVITMTIMGVASFLIGVLPTTAQVGMAAPILLVALRILQGVAVGGEWGGAALMALEHSGKKRRGFAASVANMGGPSGLLLALVVFTAFSLLPDDQFIAWGWRVPFLLSALLVAVGLFVRLKISESPLFLEAQKLKAEADRAKPPIVEVLTRHWRAVVLATGGGLAAFALQSLIATFGIALAMGAGHSRTTALVVSAIAALLHIFTIPLFAAWSDRIGRRPVMLLGVAGTVLLIHPVLLMIGSGSFALLLAAYILANPILQALMYGPLAAYVSEMFGTRSRYTGASLGYQLATTLGGGFAPLIGASLLAARGGSDPLYVSLFIIGVGALSALAIWRAAEGRDQELDTEPEVVSAPTATATQPA